MQKRHLELAVATAWLVLIGGSSEAADPAGPSVVLQLLDHTGIPSTVMAEARAHAKRVFGAIGVHVAWSDGADDPCGGADFVVTLLPTNDAGHDSTSGGIGENIAGWASRADARAFVYPGRLRALAGRTRRSFGVLLGRAIAHEVGHLTLPPGHSRTGIMANGIDTRPTTAWAQFTPEQGRAIRDRLGSMTGQAAGRQACGA